MTTTDPAPTPRSGAAGTMRIWDPMVRLFHWSLVAAFVIAWLSAEESANLHETAGYVVAGLIVFRLIWGLLGGRYARFSRFLQGPRATLSYLGDMLRGKERRYLGHNPAGAAMIVALLISLSGTALTGWLMAEPSRIAALRDAPQIVGAAWADEDGDEYGERGEKAFKDLHEALANLTLLLVALHLGGVVLASLRHRENLVRAMITGEKRGPGPGDVA